MAHMCLSISFLGMPGDVKHPLTSHTHPQNELQGKEEEGAFLSAAKMKKCSTTGPWKWKWAQFRSFAASPTEGQPLCSGRLKRKNVSFAPSLQTLNEINFLVLYKTTTTVDCSFGKEWRIRLHQPHFLSSPLSILIFYQKEYNYLFED